MKLTKSTFVSAAIALLLAGCTGSPQPAVTVTQEVTVTAEPVETATQTEEPEADEIEEEDSWDSVLAIKLVEFSVSNAECSYSDGLLELRATITNVSAKEIIAIDAGAWITDVFGEQIKGLDISSDEKIAPGDSINVGSWGNACYDLNQFSADDNRLLDMDDLDASTDVEFIVNKIAFTGGEIIDY